MVLDDATAPLRSASSRPASSDPVSLSQGMVLGRYVVLSRLGSGGAGSVYAAFDTQIDRRVALKVLHGSHDDDDDIGWSRRWDRIVREARILGKLSHPNVVTLYDLDTIDGVSFIAMELVPGTDLAGFCQAPKPWPEVVEILRQAALGLAAAHEAGIVHGDFKPANVLVGEDGRARVTDFGVARLDERLADPEVVTAETSASVPVGSTTVGRVAGTPYAMAPEQHEGRSPDARSDIYAFSVTLWEALYGARPFRGKTFEALAIEKAAGIPELPPDARPLPAWLRDVMLRGLAPDPAARPATMREVIAALDRAPVDRRRRRLLAGGLAIGSIALVAALVPTAPEPCSGAARHLQGVWDETRAAQVERALLATDLPYAPDAWNRVHDGLHAYAEGWVEEHERACRATQLGEQSATALDLRMRCLDDRRGRLAALVEVLSEPADAAVVRNAPDGVTALPAVARCADTEHLAAGPQPPDDPRVQEIERSLDRSSAYGSVGKYRDARAASEKAHAIAEELGFAPLLAKVLLELGSTQAHTGEAELAETTLGRAFHLGQRTAQDDVAANAARWLVFVVGDLQRRADAALAWAEHADALIARLGDDPLERAQLALNVGYIHLNAARFDEARPHFEQALAIREKVLGPADPDVAVVLGALGNLSLELEDYAAAEAHYQRSLEIKRAHLGERHPSLGLTWLNLGVVARRQNRPDDARARYEAAKRLWEETLGPEHPQVAIAENNLGSLLGSQGDHRGAREAYARACEIWKKSLDPEHPDIALCLQNLGEAENNLGDHEKARRLLEEALRIRLARLGPEHPHVGITRVALGDAALAAGDPESALPHYEAARDLWSAALPAEDSDHAYALVGIGRAQLELGRPAEAIEPLERALTLRPKGSEARLRAGTQFALARALAAADRDPARAHALAEAARVELSSAGAAAQDEADEVTAWLAQR